MGRQVGPTEGEALECGPRKRVAGGQPNGRTRQEMGSGQELRHMETEGRQRAAARAGGAPLYGGPTEDHTKGRQEPATRWEDRRLALGLTGT